MEEWLFNTVAFIGGPSEIKYWAELNNVFKLLNVEMPIVLPRMKMTYMMERTQKLLKQYSLNVEKLFKMVSMMTKMNLYVKKLPIRLYNK